MSSVVHLYFAWLVLYIHRLPGLCCTFVLFLACSEHLDFACLSCTLGFRLFVMHTWISPVCHAHLDFACLSCTLVPYLDCAVHLYIAWFVLYICTFLGLFCTPVHCLACAVHLYFAWLVLYNCILPACVIHLYIAWLVSYTYTLLGLCSIFVFCMLVL